MKGYTLIELVITVAVIGILAAIALPKMTSLIASAQDAKTKGNLAALRSALGVYHADTEGHYPAFPPPYDTPAAYNMILRDALVPRYIAEIPEASPSGWHHASSNKVDHVWNQTGDEDDEGVGYGGGWKYDANPFDIGIYPGYPGFGSIMVLCTHNTSKNVIWTAY